MISAIDFMICDIIAHPAPNRKDNHTLVDHSNSVFKDSDLSIRTICSKVLEIILTSITITPTEDKHELQISAPNDNSQKEFECCDTDFDIQLLWEQARNSMERAAEERARVTVRDWIKGKKTIEDCINESLSDHIDLFERAHSIRLILEHREQQVQSKIRESQSSRSVSFTGYDVRRQRDMENDHSDFYILFDNDQEVVQPERIVGNKRDAETTHEIIDLEDAVSPTKKRFVFPKLFE